ncbi:MAG: hypothetical protein KY461_11260 [Actinobacteria bacterium]|nr:hypothetical protein [Actinomycetota bacterium]
MNRRLSLTGTVLVVLGLLLAGAPVMASDPASSELTAPGEPGAEVSSTWTGTIAPGAEQSGGCAESPTADKHTLTLTVPQGTYDAVSVQMTATVTPTGPTGGGTDVIVTLVRPDGTVINADGGFVGAAETAATSNPTAGTYEVYACAFAGLVPQTYEGVVTLTASTKTPLVANSTCPGPTDVPKFEMAYIDESRAGGEPILAVHPDGQLIWGSHAGTTHFYAPEAPSPTTAAFVENYQGQTYNYVSEDGRDFTFVPRQGPGEGDVAPLAGLPATGFSDPEFAIDAAGNVYSSEINLANVAMYKSTDGGRSYGLQNVFAFTSSDRQWMEADRENEVYMTANGFGGGSFPAAPIGNLGHFMAKSTDGGVTWGSASKTNPDGVGDLRIDRERGFLYELSVTSAGDIGVARFPNIREEETDFTVEILPVTSGVGLSGVQRLIDPTLDIDDEGNLYVTWSDNGSGLRPAGIYYAASSDGGESFSLPVRVDPDDNADVWPWIAVGAPGQVVVTWLQGDQVVEGILPGEEGGDDVKWSVAAATTSTGLGCGSSDAAGFRVTTASAEPIHTGTICQHGTVCQTDATDRRLGDYFSVAAANDGDIHIAVSDTRQGGAVSLPLHIFQVGGPDLSAAPPAAPSVTPPAPPAPAPDPGPSLPTTGDGAVMLGLGLLLVALGLTRRPRRQA